jgi:hypothetical protein
MGCVSSNNHISRANLKFFLDVHILQKMLD